MKLIGLTGGIGTGKSTVAELLQKRGWEVVSSDETAKQVLSEELVKLQLVELFGEVDHKAIADAVFGSTPEAKAKLEALNRIVHPLVLERHLKIINEREEQGSPLLAIESALLYEVGLEDGFDWVVVVDAPEDVCVARAMQRLNATEEQIRARIAEQMPMTEKRGLADFVIDNGTTLEALADAVDMIATIVELLPPKSDDDEVVIPRYEGP